MSAEAHSDSQLVALARIGDKRAFDHLVERHYGTAMRVAAGMLGNRDIAQQLIQEAFLQAFLSLERLRKDSAFKSWLYGIVLNLCRESIRNRTADRALLEALAACETEQFRDTTPDPCEAAAEREMHRKVLEAVRSLPPRTRRATLLFYYRQLSVQEIASAQSVSVGTIKHQLHKARIQLRERLAPIYGEIQEETASAPERSDEMTRVKIAFMFRAETRNYTAILQDEKNHRSLPIVIDSAEGDAILAGLSEETSTRSGSHDLMIKLVEMLGGKLEEVCIETIGDRIFYAVIKLRQGKTLRELEARPGDALGLAVREEIPVYVKEEILEAEGQTASQVSFEGAASMVSLPHDDVKGKIVGKNGRNIITFETITGVKLIVNGTPKVVYVVSPDPLRRETAQLAMERLVQGDRINPGCIAEAVSEARRNIEEATRAAQMGEEGLRVYCQVSSDLSAGR